MVWGRRSSYPHPERLKEISKVIDHDGPALDEGLLKFIAWAADYYFYPLGPALSEALPPGFLSARSKKSQTIMEKGSGPGRSRLSLRGWQGGAIRELTREQEDVLLQLKELQSRGGFCPVLLHGVTGSGKTEVYLRAAEAALDAGRSVLILVPEIAMTAQAAGIFKERLGDRVALFHSGLTEAQRRDQWWGVRHGRFSVVVGTRSAIFSPLSSIGLIVVDEEHDGSYKQEERFRYNARDLALVRAKMEGALVILGSATPSVTSYHHAVTGRYRLLEMGSRPAGARLPVVELADRRGEKGGQKGGKKGQRGEERPKWLSPLLESALKETLGAGRQALIFLNRRGFATFVFCPECGHVFKCEECDVILTWHRAGTILAKSAAGSRGKGVLACHYCGRVIPALPACPRCKGQSVKASGFGTERVARDLSSMFPDARIARLDRDTAASQRRMIELLQAFRDNELDILVGTQMVTKGHDFPGLSLVGVVWADMSLNVPEFNAAERTFQLLAQVAGRAGRRSEPGRVVIQTHMPDHYAVRTALLHDYKGFFEQELEKRRALGYPPFSRIINVRISGRDWRRAEESAKALAAVARSSAAHEAKGQKGADVTVLGPAQAPKGRLKGLYRYQFMLKGSPLSALRRVCHAVMEERRRLATSGIRFDIDADPLNFM